MKTARDIIAESAHEFAETLPEDSAARTLLYSQRHGFALAAIEALNEAGYAIASKDELRRLRNAQWAAAKP